MPAAVCLCISACGGGGGGDQPSVTEPSPTAVPSATPIVVEPSASPRPNPELTASPEPTLSPVLPEPGTSESPEPGSSPVVTPSPLVTPSPIVTPSPDVTPSPVQSPVGDGFDASYCPDSTVVASSAVNNVYRYEATGNNCFGVLNDDAQKLSVPLYSDDENESLTIGSEIKIYNSTEQRERFRRLLFAVEVSNVSAEPLCFIRPEEYSVTLFNDLDEQLAVVGGGWFFDGALYDLGSATTNTCLAPEQSMVYVDHSDGVAHALLEQVAYAKFTGFSLDKRADVEPLPNLAAIEMSVSAGEVEATFINDSGRDLAFILEVVPINFFDDFGYPVHSGFIHLQGVDSVPDLNISIPGLSAYLIESGDEFTLRNIVLSEGVWPATATKAVVHLEWEFVQ